MVDRFHICKLNEDMINEEKYRQAENFASKLLLRGKMSIDEIAEDSGLTVEEVTELAAELKNQLHN